MLEKLLQKFLNVVAHPSSCHGGYRMHLGQLVGDAFPDMQYSKAGKEIYTNQLLNLMCTLYFLFLQAIKGIVTVAFVCVVHDLHHCVF